LLDIFTAGLLTLYRMPGMSLPALPMLLTSVPFRRGIELTDLSHPYTQSWVSCGKVSNSGAGP
jgi:hypothetical protein